MSANSEPPSAEAAEPSASVPQASNLAHLPVDILHKIAAVTDEFGLWRMMATCRALREAGERALRPYLAEAKVTAQRPILVHEISTLGSRDDRDYARRQARRASLLQAHIKFANHLELYPPSAELVRRLSLEVEFYDAPIWVTLENLFPQLSQLKLYVLDELPDTRLPRKPSLQDRYDSRIGHLHRSGSQQDGDVEDRPSAGSGSGRGWARLLAASSAELTNLTRLSIRGTKRRFVDCAQLAAQLPNLSDLALTSSCVNINTSGTPVDTTFTFSRLTALALYGNFFAVLDHLRQAAPHIVHLTLQGPATSSDRVARLLSTWEDLQGLSLYGGCADNLLWSTVNLQVKENRAIFLSLNLLLLEQTWLGGSGWTDEYDTCNSGRDYPLLRSKRYSWESVPMRPHLPALQCIKWIGLPRGGKKPKPGLETYDPGMEDAGGLSPFYQGFYTPSHLRDLFAHFELLDLVEWVAGYPSCPFEYDKPSTWAERNVKCGVFRPVDLADTGTCLFPYRPALGDDRRKWA